MVIYKFESKQFEIQTPERMKPRSQSRTAPSPFPDHFDRIPDSLILHIFNKLADVRSLGRCAVVSKRFNALAPLVHDVSVQIDRVVTVDGDSDGSFNLSSPRPRKLFFRLLKLMLFTILKPFHNLQGVHGGSKPFVPQVSHHSPAQVLKSFTHVRNLRIELPAGEFGMEDGVILKWRAEFGSTLESCVILGGTRMPDSSYEAEAEAEAEVEDDDGSIPEPFYTNGGLKLRVVWTIGSLIAASTRHHLLREIIKDHPTLESLVLTDAEEQGTLSMGEQQLKEFREKPLPASATASSNRTQLPAANMKLRFAPSLELPEGMAMQGATLVTIKPAAAADDGVRVKEDDSFMCRAFDGPLRAAAKALVQRRIYLLEMNGF